MSNVKVIHPHDALCPSLNCIDSGCEDCCRCDLIAKVRQDQQILSLSTRVRELKPYANGYCDGERDMLAKCIAAVEALEPLLFVDKHHGGYDCCGCSTLDALHEDALAAMRALQEKP
jgi:hypothetical protein